MRPMVQQSLPAIPVPVHQGGNREVAAIYGHPPVRHKGQHYGSYQQTQEEIISEDQIEAASILMELKYGHFWSKDAIPMYQSTMTGSLY